MQVTIAMKGTGIFWILAISLLGVCSARKCQLHAFRDAKIILLARYELYTFRKISTLFSIVIVNFGKKIVPSLGYT